MFLSNGKKFVIMAYGKIKVAKNANFCKNFSVILKSAIVFGWRNISIQKYPQVVYLQQPNVNTSRVDNLFCCVRVLYVCYGGNQKFKRGLENWSHSQIIEASSIYHPSPVSSGGRLCQEVITAGANPSLTYETLIIILSDR